MATGSRSGEQGATWTEEENVQLCKAWKTICHNPVTGAEMSKSGMWRRIHQLFSEALGGTTRQVGALPSHWRGLSGNLTKWKNALKAAKDGAGSGYSMEDEANYAMRWYMLNNSQQSFPHQLCWEVVKDCPRFRVQPSRNIFGEASPVEYTPMQDSPGGTSAEVHLTDDEVPSPASATAPMEDAEVTTPVAPTPPAAASATTTTRPQGRKAAKAAKKQSPTQSAALLEQIARNSALRIEEQRRYELARLAERQADNERLKRLEQEKEERRQAENERVRKLDQEKAERRQEKEELRIMSMDTSYMSPETKQFWKEERRNIALKRRLFRDAGSTTSGTYTPTPPSPVDQSQADPSHVEDTDWGL